jgi:hypothetical protein
VIAHARSAPRWSRVRGWIARAARWSRRPIRRATAGRSAGRRAPTRRAPSRRPRTSGAAASVLGIGVGRRVGEQGPASASESMWRARASAAARWNTDSSARSPRIIASDASCASVTDSGVAEVARESPGISG